MPAIVDVLTKFVEALMPFARRTGFAANCRSIRSDRLVRAGLWEDTVLARLRNDPEWGQYVSNHSSHPIVKRYSPSPSPSTSETSGSLDEGATALLRQHLDLILHRISLENEKSRPDKATMKSLLAQRDQVIAEMKDSVTYRPLLPHERVRVDHPLLLQDLGYVRPNMSIEVLDILSGDHLTKHQQLFDQLFGHLTGTLSVDPGLTTPMHAYCPRNTRLYRIGFRSVHNILRTTEEPKRWYQSQSQDMSKTEEERKPYQDKMKQLARKSRTLADRIHDVAERLIVLFDRILYPLLHLQKASKKVRQLSNALRQKTLEKRVSTLCKNNGILLHHVSEGFTTKALFCGHLSKSTHHRFFHCKECGAAVDRDGSASIKIWLVFLDSHREPPKRRPPDKPGQASSTSSPAIVLLCRRRDHDLAPPSEAGLVSSAPTSQSLTPSGTPVNLPSHLPGTAGRPSSQSLVLVSAPPFDHARCQHDCAMPGVSVSESGLISSPAPSGLPDQSFSVAAIQPVGASGSSLERRRPGSSGRSSRPTSRSTSARISQSGLVSSTTSISVPVQRVPAAPSVRFPLDLAQSSRSGPSCPPAGLSGQADGVCPLGQRTSGRRGPPSSGVRLLARGSVGAESKQSPAPQSSSRATKRQLGHSSPRAPEEMKSSATSPSSSIPPPASVRSRQRSTPASSASSSSSSSHQTSKYVV